MNNAAVSYFEQTTALLDSLRKTQLPAIDKAAELCADRISKGGLVFLFGNGHSRMMCEEMIPRQGCYPGFVALVELALSNHANIVGTNGLRAPLHLEKYEGYAEEILKSFKFGPQDAMIVISTSGLRPVIVEMAMGAKKRGMPVVGIVSEKHCRDAKPGHSSGKKLVDVADFVIDNQCPPGDCIVEIPGLEWRTGPTSTVTGGMIINMIRCRVAELLVEKGKPPVLLPSHQFVGSRSVEEQLEFFYAQYARSVAPLYARQGE